MADRSGLITFKGNPLTLTGDVPAVGAPAPDFTAAANDLSQVKLSKYAGKVVILSAVPSLDTPTCNTETRRLDKELASLGPDVVLLTISLDLPFAQKRWCGEAAVQHVVTLSDYRGGEFGRKYGVLIKELGLLARAVFVVGRDGVLLYQQIVREVSSEPNYDEVLAAARALVGSAKARA